MGLLPRTARHPDQLFFNSQDLQKSALANDARSSVDMAMIFQTDELA